MPISGIIVTNHHSPYPLSKNIAILVFPTLLQKQIHLREVFTFYVRYPTETGSTNTLFPIRHINFIVKLHSDRFLGKGNTGIQHLLQKRWEDKDGNIFAKRVGTMVVRYYNTTDWHNNATYSIMYGDITGDPAYKPHMMRLQVEERYAINSKGESVPVKEVAWGTEEDAPTHLLLQFTSSHGGAYIGSPGNSLWIDNVKLVY